MCVSGGGRGCKLRERGGGCKLREGRRGGGTSPKAAEVKATSPEQLAKVTPQARTTSEGEVGVVGVAAEEEEGAVVVVVAPVLLSLLLLLSWLTLVAAVAVVAVVVTTLPPCKTIVVTARIVDRASSTYPPLVVTVALTVA